MLWGLFALLTGAAVFAILWPLAKGRRGLASRAAPDVAFYKAKLVEIERETTSDLLSPQEAEAARTEAARRLLRAADAGPLPAKGVSQVQASSQFRVRLVAVLALAFVPALSLGLYAALGHPSWPDAPLAARLDVAPKDVDLAAGIARVEAHLLRHPEDGRGYEALVSAYLDVGRVNDAVRAAAMAIEKLGDTPQREAVYGETLVYAADGVVTEDARKAFASAAAAESAPPKALFFLGLAAAQEGDKARALGYWQKLLAQVPQGAPGRADLEAKIAELEKSTPPKVDEAAAIAALSPDAREAAIHSMIDRLAARLAQNGHDIEGWLRLVRAYKVMNETDKARAALATARHDLGGDAEAIARLDALARELGLDS
ncbi:MAG: c-type cytochrome biogenesis protein CcmI [Methylovirgula sp.]